MMTPNSICKYRWSKKNNQGKGKEGEEEEVQVHSIPPQTQQILLSRHISSLARSNVPFSV
jgi:hypothetical protein